MILLKNKKSRICCFKILLKKFQDFQENKDLEEAFDPPHEIENVELQKIMAKIQSQNNDPTSYYPNSFLISNALSQCLEDDDTVVKKVTLDFMVKFIDLKT